MPVTHHETSHPFHSLRITKPVRKVQVILVWLPHILISAMASIIHIEADVNAGCGREVHAHSTHDLSSLYFKKLSSCLWMRGNENEWFQAVTSIFISKNASLLDWTKCVVFNKQHWWIERCALSLTSCVRCLIVFWCGRHCPILLYTSLKLTWCV